MDPRQTATLPEMINRNRPRLNQEDASPSQGPREEAVDGLHPSLAQKCDCNANSLVSSSYERGSVYALGASGTSRPTCGWRSKPDADRREELRLSSFETERPAASCNASGSLHLISGWGSKPDNIFADRKEVDREHCHPHVLGQGDVDDHGRADRSENWRKDSVLEDERLSFRTKEIYSDKYHSENRVQIIRYEETDSSRTPYLEGTTAGDRNENRKEQQQSSRLDKMSRSERTEVDNSGRTCSNDSSGSDENDRNKSISRKYGEIKNVTSAKRPMNRTKKYAISLSAGGGGGSEMIESRSRMKKVGSSRRNRTTSTDSSLAKSRSRMREGSSRRNGTTSTDSSPVGSRSRMTGEGSSRRNGTVSTDSSLVENRSRMKEGSCSRRHRTTSTDRSPVESRNRMKEAGCSRRNRTRSTDRSPVESRSRMKEAGCSLKNRKTSTDKSPVESTSRMKEESCSRRHRTTRTDGISGESRSRMKEEGCSRRNRTASTNCSLEESRSRMKEEGGSRRNRTTSTDSSPVESRIRMKGEGSSKRNRTTSTDSSLEESRIRMEEEGSSRRNRTTSTDNRLVGNTSTDMVKGSIEIFVSRGKTRGEISSRNRANEPGKEQGGDGNRKFGGCGSKNKEGASRKDCVGDGGKRHREESNRKHGESSSKKQGGVTRRRNRYMRIEDSLEDSTDTDSKSSRGSSTADKSVHRGRRKTKESRKHWETDHDTSLESGTKTNSNESSSTETSVDRHVNYRRRNTYVKRRFKTQGNDRNKRNSGVDSSASSCDDSDVDKRRNDDKRSREKRKKTRGDITTTLKNRKPTPSRSSSSKSINRSNSLCRKERSQHGYSRKNKTNNDNVIMDSIRHRIKNYDGHAVESSSGKKGERKRLNSFVASTKEEKYSNRVSGLRNSFRKKSIDKKIISESRTKHERERPNKTSSKSDIFEMKIPHDEGSSSDILSSGESGLTSLSDNGSESSDGRRLSNYAASRDQTAANNISKHNTLASNVSKNKTSTDNVNKAKPSADKIVKSTSARSDIAKPPPNEERKDGEMTLDQHDYSKENKDLEHLSDETDLQTDEKFEKMESLFLKENCYTAASTDQHQKNVYFIGGSELLTLTEDEFNFIMGNDSPQQTRRAPLADTLKFSPESFNDPLTPTLVTKGASPTSVSGSSTSTSSIFSEVSGSSVGQFKWQFADKNGIWITYGKVDPLDAAVWPSTTSEDIEKHYASPGPNVSMLIGSGTRNWVINFQKMVQIDRRTLEKCPIRRILNTFDNCEEILGQDPSIHHEWQYKAESGYWITIGQSMSNQALNLNKNTSDFIEKQYMKSPEKASLLITITGQFFELDFRRMTKTPLDFKNSESSQPIRRITNSSHPGNFKHDQLRNFSQVKAESKSATAPGTEYEWYFRDEKICWIKYGQPNTLNKVDCIPTTSSDDIEKQYKENPTKCMHIGSQQHTYLINFIKMTQTNIKTRVERPIARMLKFSKYDTEKHARIENRDTETNNRDGWGLSSSRFANPLPQHYEEFLHDFSKNPTIGKDSLPPHWSPISSSASWTKILVTPSSHEYNERLTGIRKSNPTCRVQNLYRVQNEYLWRAYVNKKKYLEQQYPGIKFKEEYLFHGTNPKNVAAICEENVDWRLHGTLHGNAFGRGSYFSNSAKISAGYSKSRKAEGITSQARFGKKIRHLNARPPQWPQFAAAGSAPSRIFGTPHHTAGQPIPTEPLRVMFIVRVLIGRTIRGTTSTVMPPRDGSGVPYDTTVNNVASPSIFVKYDSQEYYPEYIVEFY